MSTQICKECDQPAEIGFSADKPVFCLNCANKYRVRANAFELDPDIKQKIVTAAGIALGLEVPIMAAVKIKFDNDADKMVPLGSVLIMPVLRWYHTPVWLWRKGRVRAAVRKATPQERQVFVFPASAVEHARFV